MECCEITRGDSTTVPVGDVADSLRVQVVAVRPVAPRGDVKGHQQRHHAVGVMYGLAVQRRLLATY